MVNNAIFIPIQRRLCKKIYKMLEFKAEILRFFIYNLIVYGQKYSLSKFMGDLIVNC